MKNRIIGYDLARALALFGMVIVNFKIVMGAADNGAPWLVYLTGLLDGRAAATFVLLAGIGISLLSGSARRSNAPKATVPIRNTLLKRALFLFVVGLLYTPVWPADILHFYGVYIAVAALLLTSSIRKLSILSFLLMVGFVFMFFAFNYEQEWNWKTLEYAGFWTPVGMIRNLFFNGFHPTIPWLSFLLIGMIIGRFEMNNLVVRRRVFWVGLVTALAAEGTSWFLIQSLSAGVSLADQEAIVAIYGTKPMPPMPLYILAGAGTASAIVAALVGIGVRCGSHRWIRPWVATGQLALTLYVAHVVIGMGILEAIGRLENQTLSFSLLASGLFFTSSVVFAYSWCCRFKRGPIEMLMRYLTEKKQHQAR
jgi:uncharacterized membrane protein YeiB